MEDLTTCEISDALIKLDSPHGGHIPDIYLISPMNVSHASRPFRVEGPAHTVQMVLFNDKDAPKPPNHFVDAAEAGSMIVIDAPLSVKSAVWGGFMTFGAQARGVKGVVISGRCRDVNEHRQAGFPVFARGTSTLGQKPFTRPSVVGGELLISPVSTSYSNTIDNGNEVSWPPVRVRQGDWIVADENGVVCVPIEDIDQVKEIAKKAREIDERCALDIKAGEGIEKTFKQHRGS